MRIVDVHTHAGKWMFPIAPASLDDLLGMERAAGIETCVVSSAPAIVYDFREGNAELAAGLDGRTGCFGYVVANPHYLEESLDEMAAYARHPKFVGLKLHHEQQAFAMDDPAVARLVEEAARLRWPVLAHTFSVAAAAHLRALAARHPALPFIMAHMGGAQWRQAIPVVADAPNIYLDPCSSYAERGKVELAVALVGPGRVVFGSDATLFNPWFTRGMVDGAALDDETRRRIYWDNARVIFGERLD
ncbi:MAG: amidohydrolase family protein [Armatimonadota bacterium]|nr:amidohydrolase family protein [Armatimonadota bacterium]